jgi:hypothetical protein
MASCNEYGELCGLHNPQRELDTGFKQPKSPFFSGTSVTMFDLTRRKKAIEKLICTKQTIKRDEFLNLKLSARFLPQFVDVRYGTITLYH